MAVWLFLDAASTPKVWKEKGRPTSSWDDGLSLLPEEPGFSREAADKKAASLGEGVSANFVCTPSWSPAEVATDPLSLALADGWKVHSENSEMYWKGGEVVSEAHLIQGYSGPSEPSLPE